MGVIPLYGLHSLDENVSVNVGVNVNIHMLMLMSMLKGPCSG